MAESQPRASVCSRVFPERPAVPLGIPEILREGTDITLVTYGATCYLVMEAAERLSQIGISCEVIDVQTLLPFDLTGTIGKSVEKTNKILFVDDMFLCIRLIQRFFIVVTNYVGSRIMHTADKLGLSRNINSF